jgi:CRISPR-associated endonuclease/helicase Cas3
MSELLAKSPKGDSKVLLVDHSRHVIEAAAALFGSTNASRLGECWLRFFNVEQHQWPTFRDTLRTSAALHDLGKANDGFQKAVRNQGEQAVRHEHLSGLMMFHPPVWRWLQTIQGIDWDIALSAVLSHHLKVTDKSLADLLQTGKNWSVR